MTIARVGPAVIVGALATNERDQAKINFAIRRLQEEINANTDLMSVVGATTTISSAGTTNLDASYNSKTVFVDATASNITLTITANASLPTDWFVHLVRIDGSANTVTVDPNGVETVDGRTGARLINKYDQATVVKQGSNFVTRNARWKQREIIYNSGSPTFDVSVEVPLGCNSYLVEAWGAGGSGGGSDTGTPMRASGAGSGAYGNKRIATTLDTSLTCTPGIGGAAVSSIAGGQNGNAGGNTTIVGGNLGTLTAGGGGAGQGATVATAGGAGGTATGAWDETITGADGFTSNASLAGTGVYPGGSAPRGGPGGCSNVGSNGRAPGGAGAGSNHLASSPSGAGANGRIKFTI